MADSNSKARLPNHGRRAIENFLRDRCEATAIPQGEFDALESKLFMALVEVRTGHLVKGNEVAELQALESLAELVESTRETRRQWLKVHGIAATRIAQETLEECCHAIDVAYREARQAARFQLHFLETEPAEKRAANDGRPRMDYAREVALTCANFWNRHSGMGWSHGGAWGEFVALCFKLVEIDANAEGMARTAAKEIRRRQGK